MSKVSPFQIVKIINEKLEYDWDDHAGSYNSWMVNSALSNHQYTVLFANEMNQYYDLSDKQQFAFYYNAIKKGRRYGKWQKKDEISDIINIITEHFSVNKQIAMQYLKLLSDEQIDCIRKNNMKGGLKNDRRGN